jgi:hypothetical protein
MRDADEARRYAERMRAFLQNQEAFPPDELEKYAGQWIAWSDDGTRILAGSSESSEAVGRLVRALGHDPSACVFDYLPGLDEVIPGGL